MIFLISTSKVARITDLSPQAQLNSYIFCGGWCWGYEGLVYASNHTIPELLSKPLFVRDSSPSCVVQAGLEFVILCLSLLSAGISGEYHHAQL
jgi:hypothetical protein